MSSKKLINYYLIIENECSIIKLIIRLFKDKWTQKKSIKSF